MKFNPFKKRIIVKQPKPYEEVGAQFVISGLVPKSWLDTGYGIDDRVFLDLIDINGQTFMGTSVPVSIKENCLLKFTKILPFYSIFQFSQFNVSFITKSQGRITLKLHGHKKDQQLFIPIIARNSNPNFKVDPEIRKKHKKIGKMIMRYEKDLLEYNKAWASIQERRKRKSGITEDDEKFYSYFNDWEVVGGLVQILGQPEDVNESYPLLEEDLAEKEIEKKYKDAIQWRGPLVGGVVGVMAGFEFRVYSNDHGKHFHVIHKGRGINARFSFPVIGLIDYKNTKTSIRTKEKEMIVDFFKDPKNFHKLKEWFDKRG